jgi:UDP-N-acetylmuramoyl-tripeptide--D-alanyl-D-alanine ligase
MVLAATLRTAPWSGSYAKLRDVTEVQPPPLSGGSATAPAFSADDLARLTAGRILARSSRPIRGAAVDSRLVTPGQLFVALPGERTDGHRFLDAAAAAGAAGLLVTRDLAPSELDQLGDVTVVRVADGLAALQALAAAWRDRFDPLVVAVTGSIAKTSTKEAIAAVLGRRFVTLKNEGNLNNEIGLPLTVLGMGPDHEAAVLEMGMYVGGEIATLARIGRPRIGVVTAVQPVHLARIGSIDAIERAKGELVEALPADGTAVLNADDPRVRRMSARTPARSLTYGFAEDADVRADRVESAGGSGMRFRLVRAGRTVSDVSIPALGRLSVHNALAAAAVGFAAGLTEGEVVRGLAAGWGAPHRASLLHAGGVTIVDDTYNASPASMAAALEMLGGLPGRRIAVLGEMLELGDAHDAGHRDVGEAAADVADLLVVVGLGARGIADGARAAGFPSASIETVSDRDAALDLLARRLRDGDVVLVKASRGIELDRLVDGLIPSLESRTDPGSADARFGADAQ